MNCWLAVETPSEIMTVIVAVPKEFGAGVTVMVRLVPLPPNTMFELVTSVAGEATTAVLTVS